ncbi:MAG TPA: hypothetical protein VF626_07965, partial [Chthoniobacterales bacterium]
FGQTPRRHPEEAGWVFSSRERARLAGVNLRVVAAAVTGGRSKSATCNSISAASDGGSYTSPPAVVFL